MATRIITADVLDGLRGLPDQSVHCCVTSPPYYGLRSYLPNGHPDKAREIGLEETPDAYVARLVEVFRGVRRVLRDDGTLWLNLGDSYAASGPSRHKNTGGAVGEGSKTARIRRLHRDCGIKDKDLLLIPHRVALALQADGWWVRSEIVWAKRSPMPESVKDRPTNAHEKVFLLSKRPAYFFDAYAIRERAMQPDRKRADAFGGKHHKERGQRGQHSPGSVFTGSQWKNTRSVWTIHPEAFSGQHFAVMPTKLAERCILAGSSARGACPHCGAPWRRIVEKGEPDHAHRRACGADSSGGYNGKSTKGHAAAGVQDASAVKARILAGMVQKRTVGWEPKCSCPEHDPVPAVVLDPFGGSGSTAVAAERLGRDSVLIDLDPRNEALVRQRLAPRDPKRKHRVVHDRQADAQPLFAFGGD